MAKSFQLDGSWSTKRMLDLESGNPWERNREHVGLRTGFTMR